MARQYDQVDHPFRDDGIDLPPPTAKAHRTEPEYAPTNYEQSLASRGGLILLLGSLGLGCLLPLTYVAWIISFRPILLLSWGLSLPALFLGLADIRAMRAGVMERRHRSLTWLGVILGGLASLTAAGYGLSEVIAFFWNLWWSFL